jgi:hypothetical protein
MTPVLQCPLKNALRLVVALQLACTTQVRSDPVEVSRDSGATPPVAALPTALQHGMLQAPGAEAYEALEACLRRRFAAYAGQERAWVSAQVWSCAAEARVSALQVAWRPAAEPIARDPRNGEDVFLELPCARGCTFDDASLRYRWRMAPARCACIGGAGRHFTGCGSSGYGCRPSSAGTPGERYRLVEDGWGPRIEELDRRRPLALLGIPERLAALVVDGRSLRELSEIRGFLDGLPASLPHVLTTQVGLYSTEVYYLTFEEMRGFAAALAKLMAGMRHGRERPVGAARAQTSARDWLIVRRAAQSWSFSTDDDPACRGCRSRLEAFVRRWAGRLANVRRPLALASACAVSEEVPEGIMLRWSEHTLVFRLPYWSTASTEAFQADAGAP